MVADHLSRLELGEQWDKACIQEMFLDEQLMRVEAIVPWFAYVNYLACKVLPLNLSSQQKKKFLHDVRSYLWDDTLLFKRGLIKSLDGVCPMRKCPIFFTIAILHHMEDTLVHKGLLLRCYSLVSFGLHYSVMRMHMWRVVIDSREWAISPEGMNGLWTISWRLRIRCLGYRRYEAISAILWAIVHPFGCWIMWVSRWKLFPP